MPRASLTSRTKSIHPIKGGGPPSARLERAYERLGVTPSDVESIPKISHILDKLPGKRGSKGINKAIEFLRGTDNPDAKKFLKMYDLVAETSRKYVPFEAYIFAAGLTSKRMLEIITGACFEQSASTSALLAAAAHPEVVEATVKAAKQESGSSDRKMLHQHSGFIPVPKNQTNFFAPGSNQNNVQGDQKQLNVGVGELASIETVMGRITNRFNEQPKQIQGQVQVVESTPALPPVPSESQEDIEEDD